jgi:predicted RNA-binding Zn-ribbon protein involved in translation (DUF1610 family)
MPKVNVGMRCPACGAATKARNIKPQDDGTIVRYRSCPECGFTGDSREAWEKTHREGAKAAKRP